jgi:hypothetical protein
MKLFELFRRTPRLLNAYDRRARFGAEILDRHFDGPEWDERIDLDGLSMHSVHDCVLAQLYGRYTPEMDLGMDPWDYRDNWPFSGNENMDEAWDRLIRDRRRARAQASLEREAEMV